MSFNFMAAVTICSDFGAQKYSLSLFPHLFAMRWWCIYKVLRIMPDSCQAFSKYKMLVLSCHFFYMGTPVLSLQSLNEVKMRVTWSCPTLCNPMDYPVHGILQARILEWVAFPFSRGSSQPRDWTQVSCTAGRFFTSWATREAQEYWSR